MATAMRSRPAHGFGHEIADVITTSSSSPGWNEPAGVVTTGPAAVYVAPRNACPLTNPRTMKLFGPAPDTGPLNVAAIVDVCGTMLPAAVYGLGFKARKLEGALTRNDVGAVAVPSVRTDQLTCLLPGGP